MFKKILRNRNGLCTSKHNQNTQGQQQLNAENETGNDSSGTKLTPVRCEVGISTTCISVNTCDKLSMEVISISNKYLAKDFET
jgi:hypothetical protein